MDISPNWTTYYVVAMLIGWATRHNSQRFENMTLADGKYYDAALCGCPIAGNDCVDISQFQRFSIEEKSNIHYRRLHRFPSITSDDGKQFTDSRNDSYRPNMHRDIEWGRHQRHTHMGEICSRP